MIQVRCPRCETALRVREAARGGQVKCPQCGTPFRVGPAQPPPAPPAPARTGRPAREETPVLMEVAPPPRGKAALWVGLGAGAVVLVGGAVLAAVLALGGKSEPEGKPPPPQNPAPPPLTAVPKALFQPPAVLHTFPEVQAPAATLASNPGTVPVLNVDKGRGLSTNAKLAGVAVLPDGDRCVAAGSDGKVEVWNYRTGQQGRQFTVAGARLGGLAANPDGTHLAINAWDEQFRFFVVAWDLAGGRELWRSDPVPAAFSGVSVSPDGGKVMGWSREPGGGLGRVRIWDLGSGKLLKDLPGKPTGAITNAAWYPNARQVFLARKPPDRVAEDVTVWDSETGAEVPFLNLKQSRVATSLRGWAVAPAGDRLLLRVGKDLILVRTDNASTLWKVRADTATDSGLAFSKDGRRLLCWGGASLGGRLIDCFVHVLDARTGHEVCRLESVVPFRSAAFTADGKAVVAVSRGLAVWTLPE